MAVPDRASRRKSLLSAAVSAASLLSLAAGVCLLSGNTGQPGSDQPKPKPDAVLNMLLDGNKRFVEGRLLHPGRTPTEFRALAQGQKPVAAIVGCADSRVPPEVIFDQGVGDLFVVRVAGNIVRDAGPTVKGSVEY